MHLQFEDGKRFELDGDVKRISIGRDASNEIVLEDPQVSGFHATLLIENGGVEIMDLGSQNGTQINGCAISQRTTLKPWDRLRFGDTELEVVDGQRRRPTVLRPAIERTPAPAAPPPRVDDSAALVATLKLVSRHDAPSEIPIRGPLRIGRAADNHIVLNHDTVSGNHAEILVEADCPIVADAQSTNGTYINGARIQRQLLRDGDRVRFDEVEYRVVWPGTAAPTRVNPAVTVGTAKTVVNPAIPPQGSNLPSEEDRPVPPSAPASRAYQKSEAATGSKKQPAKPLSSQKTTVSPSADASFEVVDDIPASDFFATSDPASGNITETVIGPSVAPPPEQKGGAWLFFSLEGRINRTQFFLSSLALAAFLFGINALIQLVFFGSITFDSFSQQYWTATFIGWIIGLRTILAIATKRFHDQDRTGHWCWLLFIPVVSVIPGLMLLFIPGSKGPNRFGIAPA